MDPGRLYSRVMKLPSLPSKLTARLFLGATTAVVVLIAAQAWLALGSQQRIAHKVLRDHAASAIWYYQQNLETDLNMAIECIFHEALHTIAVNGSRRTVPSGALLPNAPPPQELLDTWFNSEQCAPLAPGTPRGAYRFGPGDATEIAGVALPATLLAELRALVETSAHERPPIRRTDGVVAGMAGGKPQLVFYSRQRVPGGDAVYAIPMEAVDAAVLFHHALRGFRLLPPPVLPDRGRQDVMRLVVGMPGAHFFRTRAEGATVVTATTELPASFGGLIVTAEVTPVGASMLAQPPLPAGHVPVLLALMLLSLALVLLAYRQLRREQELARLRGDFVASVSHELRTPLALQRIFLDTIRLGRAEEPDRMHWALGNLDTESRRLEHLVSNILHFARSERGQHELDLRRTELCAAVQRTVAAYRPLAEQREVTIEVVGEAPVHVALDESAFHQALANVIENAVKYGPDGQRVTVRVAEAPPWAFVDIEDAGPGIPADEREHVLDPFRRGRSTRGGTVAGSGIGLSVARDVVALHGGRIAIDSPGAGLRVRLSLPLPAPHHTDQPPAIPAAIPPADGTVAKATG
jgi:signal transduction histidine kinase